MDKYILVRAFLKGNLGDDLFIRTLCRKMSNEKFILIAPQKYRYLNNEPNLWYINSDSNFLKLLSKMINAIFLLLGKFHVVHIKNVSREIIVTSMLGKLIKDTVFISGSAYIENNDFSFSSIKFQEDQWLLKRHPTIIGTNFGPYKTESFLNTYLEIFKKARFIFFRDKYSFDLFKNKLSNVYYSPDVLFGYEENKINITNSIPKDVVFLSVCNLCKDHDGTEKFESVYIDFISKCVKYCLKNNFHVALVAFSVEQGDLAVINRICKNIKHHELIHILAYPNDNENIILKWMEQSKAVIATRYHAMILAIKFKKPVYVISYNKKIEYVINDIGFPSDMWINLEDLSSCNTDAVINKLIKTANCDIYVQNLIYESNRPFLMFEKYVSNLPN